ncbi:dephospho-CoA kinase [Algiphilus aromaticivorans]|uniref:dephospho-CoA kinase n=1 Tax=Algiphilus aromaticivorans TaxID=382454 RepID=UPI0005C1C939|nr:dephospho-CoA kinase [Algiphilus aromaticivorans]
MSLVVGLTGGVASGKSTVERAFAALGVPVIDADQVAREVVAPGEPALAAIAERFGEAVLDAEGCLDRSGLRAIVFNDEGARRDLEAITHPAIRERLLAWREALTAPYGVLSAALMVEGGLARLCDRVLVVDAEEAQQRDRVMARDAVDADMAERMLAAQVNRQTRLSAADDVLCNSSDVTALEAGVERLHDFYSRLAAGEADTSERIRLP